MRYLWFIRSNWHCIFDIEFLKLVKNIIIYQCCDKLNSEDIVNKTNSFLEYCSLLVVCYSSNTEFHCRNRQSRPLLTQLQFFHINIRNTRLHTPRQLNTICSSCSKHFYCRIFGRCFTFSIQSTVCHILDWPCLIPLVPFLDQRCIRRWSIDCEGMHKGKNKCAAHMVKHFLELLVFLAIFH